MELTDKSAYTRRDLVRAINISAFLGWLAFSMPFIWSNISVLPFAAAIGLPIAFLMCWTLGAFILTRAMQHSITWFKSAYLGAVIAFSIAAINIAIFRFLGWRSSLNPNSSSQIGGGDYIRSIDGILTPYGWWVLAQSTAMFVLIGIITALVVRAIIGEGNTNHRLITVDEDKT